MENGNTTLFTPSTAQTVIAPLESSSIVEATSSVRPQWVELTTQASRLRSYLKADKAIQHRLSRKSLTAGIGTILLKVSSCCGSPYDSSMSRSQAKEEIS